MNFADFGFEGATILSPRCGFKSSMIILSTILSPLTRLIKFSITGEVPMLLLLIQLEYQAA
jgi:hypothetical protein